MGKGRVAWVDIHTYGTLVKTRGGKRVEGGRGGRKGMLFVS